MLTQDNKPFSIKTPLGENVLLLAGFSGSEGISELFRFDLELFSEHPSIVPEDIVGQQVTLFVFLPWEEEFRFFNGLIADFSQEFGRNEKGREGQPLFRYSATMVPSLWLLTQTSDSRIFQTMSVPDIVEKVFSDNGFTDFKKDLTGEYEKREYTVQYNETDFNFISRLLEEEGIHYFFTHEDGKHTLTMADHGGAHLPCPHQETARFLRSGNEDFGDEDLIDRLKKVSRIQAGKYTLRDYNYELPDTDLEVTYDTTIALGPGERERYDYPGGYTKRKAGDHLAAIRMEAQEGRIATWSGVSNCRSFGSGFCFALKESYQDDWNEKDYLLTRIEHNMDQAATYLSSPAAGHKENRTYENRFECMPHEIPYRPLQKTKVPVIEGIQTAVVVGPKGEEIYTDELGRVKVQFHWDREGKFDENTTCWLRVAQSMAGLGWGAVFLPRIGHEVIVEFIEGNPDRPIITGQVYNGVNTPPYPLPDEKTKTAFKSSSSPGGSGFNELRFEDKAGEEQLFIHAQRQMDIRVQADQFETIGHDRNLVVENDKKENIANDRHEIIGANHAEEIGGDRSLRVAGKQSVAIAGKVSLTAGADLAENVAANHAETVGGDYCVQAGGNIVLEAGANITLKIGGNYVAIDASGITINAAGMVEVKGASMVKLQGASVLIN